ncbi:ABC transporter ATP-binding protein [Bavariicoccus seileri]|uniref:ABC transporter ATP-binding protein n=1 Tax=Bavariicoccus seileri TaxID=549685 RepID=UPI003F93BACC
MIELVNISITFGKKVVLDHLSESFKPGEIIGLVAPNGTGKSTLMSIMMNYIKPDEGQVVFKEGLQYTSPQKTAKIHEMITMMPSQHDLYNHLSGLDHLKLYHHIWSKTSLPIDEVVAALQMEDYVSQKVGGYSLGMRQRLGFAMQIVANTPIMLMDEVMNGLDPDNVSLLSTLLVKKRAEGKLIIIASHLLENLEQYANKVFFLKDGKVIYRKNYDTPDQSEALFIKFRLPLDTVVDAIFKQIIPEEPLQRVGGSRWAIAISDVGEENADRIQKALWHYYHIPVTIGPLDLLDHYALSYGE